MSVGKFFEIDSKFERIDSKITSKIKTIYKQYELNSQSIQNHFSYDSETNYLNECRELLLSRIYKLRDAQLVEANQIFSKNQNFESLKSKIVNEYIHFTPRIIS